MRLHSTILSHDPFFLPSRAALSSSHTLSALRAHEKKTPEASLLARLALNETHDVLRRLCLTPKLASASAIAPHSAWFALPSSFTAVCERLLYAALRLDLGLLHDFCAVDGEGEGSALPPRRDVLEPRYSLASDNYEAAAHNDGNDRRVWQLWASALKRCGKEANHVYAEAVRRGLWARAEQRPLQLVGSLVPSATPWHDARAHDACALLRKEFSTIREELLRALAARAAPSATEGGGDAIFAESRARASARGLASFSGGALADGAWGDLTLFVNGRRHDSNCAHMPKTAELLGSRLRVEATSNP